MTTNNTAKLEACKKALQNTENEKIKTLLGKTTAPEFIESGKILLKDSNAWTRYPRLFSFFEMIVHYFPSSLSWISYFLPALKEKHTLSIFLQDADTKETSQEKQKIPHEHTKIPQEKSENTLYLTPKRGFMAQATNFITQTVSLPITVQIPIDLTSFPTDLDEFIAKIKTKYETTITTDLSYLNYWQAAGTFEERVAKIDEYEKFLSPVDYFKLLNLLYKNHPKESSLHFYKNYQKKSKSGALNSLSENEYIKISLVVRHLLHKTLNSTSDDLNLRINKCIELLLLGCLGDLSYLEKAFNGEINESTVTDTKEQKNEQKKNESHQFIDVIENLLNSESSAVFREGNERHLLLRDLSRKLFDSLPDDKQMELDHNVDGLTNNYLTFLNFMFTQFVKIPSHPFLKILAWQLAEQLSVDFLKSPNDETWRENDNNLNIYAALRYKGSKFFIFLKNVFLDNKVKLHFKAPDVKTQLLKTIHGKASFIPKNLSAQEYKATFILLNQQYEDNIATPQTGIQACLKQFGKLDNQTIEWLVLRNDLEDYRSLLQKPYFSAFLGLADLDGLANIKHYLGNNSAITELCYKIDENLKTAESQYQQNQYHAGNSSIYLSFCLMTLLLNREENDIIMSEENLRSLESSLIKLKPYIDSKLFTEIQSKLTTFTAELQTNLMTSTPKEIHKDNSPATFNYSGNNYALSQTFLGKPQEEEGHVIQKSHAPSANN